MYYAKIQGMALIPRNALLARIENGLEHFRALALLGARQVGKTTLLRMLGEHKRITRLFDLENAIDFEHLARAPQRILGELSGIVAIDEVQRLPELFALLRPLCDRRPLPAKFILTGSTSPTLVKGVSESLAGRCLYMDIPGLSLDEVGRENLPQLWLRGGFPDSYTLQTDTLSLQWRRQFITAFVERDLPQFGITSGNIPALAMRRFWMMTAHYHGQIWNASELARSMDATHKIMTMYRDLLAGSYMLRVLTPWFENVGKRLVKSPKVYIRDSGILHALLGLETQDDLQSSPSYGASWEGFGIEQVLSALGEQDAYFYATQAGAELDLMLLRHGRRWGFEFKCTDAPRMTPSMRIALEDLKLQRAWIIYPGDTRYPVHEKVEALPLTAIGEVAGEMQRIIAGT